MFSLLVVKDNVHQNKARSFFCTSATWNKITKFIQENNSIFMFKFITTLRPTRFKL